MKKENFVLVGNCLDFMVYRNSEGFLEGYKKVGKRIVNEENIGTDSVRIVTNQTTLEGFEQYIKGLGSGINRPPKKTKKDNRLSTFLPFETNE